MIRLLLLLLCITALSLGLAWIADEPGHAVIAWGNYHIETSVLVIVAAVAAITLLCMIIYALLYTLIRSPHLWLRSRLARRQALGLDALTQTFAAIATQDTRGAKKQIARAQQFLPHQPLTLMLAAQVARLEGNDSQARLYLEQMLKSEGTEFMALRSLIENAKRSHNEGLALSYAEKALALKPQDTWLIRTAVGLYVQKGLTQNALRLLDVSARKRYISRQELHELSAYTLYENVLVLKDQQRWDFAIAVLEDILRRMPDFAPAVALLAEAYTRQGEVKRALKIIATAWKASPHPLLSQTLIQCYDENKDRQKVVSAIEKMAQVHPQHRESQFLLAMLAIKRNDYDTARRYLRHLHEGEESVRLCSLMAEIENTIEDREQAGIWLKRASQAQNDPTYVCDSCQQTADAWRLSCPQCGSVASLVWK